MAGSVFGFDAAGPMDGFGAVKPATEDPKARFDRLAGQYQVPANLLIALTEAGGDVGKADAIAADIGARVKSGKTLDVAVSELTGSPEKSAALMSRAYDIADMLYPRQVEAEKPVEPSMPRDLAAGAGGAVVSGAGLGVDYVGSAMGRAMGVPDENTTLGEYIGSKLKGAGQKISSYVSPETQRLRDATLPKGDVTDPSTWQAPEDVNLRGVMQAMAEGLGSMAPVVVTALATRGSSLAAGGVGGAMAGGDGRDTAAQIIDQKWQERGDDGKSSLERESDVYRALISEGKTPNQAYTEVRNRAMNAAGDYQAVVGGVGGAVTGGIVSKGLPAALAGKSAIANAGRGVAVSAVEEGIQEAGETAAARTGVNQASNLGLNVTEGTVEAAAAGALAGGPVGGLAGMSGAQGEPQPAPGPEPDPLQITDQSKRLALPAPGSKTLALPAPPKPPGTGFVMVDGEAQASPADGSGGGDVAASGGEVNMPASPGAAIDPMRKPEGILSQAAAVAPDLRPIPEAPAPESLFPDHKPGNALRLQTPDGSIIDATYLREGPNGVTLRVGGNTFDISPQEFDQAVNGARAADVMAKQVKASKGTPKAAQPAPAPIAETKPASPVAAPEAPVSAPLAQQAVAAVRQPEAVSPEMPAMTPEKAMEMIKTIEETAKRGGWTKRLIAKKEELSRIAAPAMQQPGGADDKGNSGAAPLPMDGLKNGSKPSPAIGDDNAGASIKGKKNNPKGTAGGSGDPQERPTGPGLRSNMDDAGQTGIPDNQLSEPTTDFLGVQATKADLEQFVAQRSALVAERKQAMKSAKKEGKAELIKKNAETNKLIEEAKQALAGKFEAKAAPEPASPPVETPEAETGTEPVTAEQAMAKASVRTLSSDEVARVGFDAKAFQYKANGDESGVTERLQGVAEWDEASAMGGMVYEFADGRMVVADGHQRLGLARRLQEQGKLTPWTVSVFREADGFTPAQIRMIAALKNIREGSGTAIDAAKVMRDAGGDAASLNLPPKSALVRDAKGLAMLSQDAFGMVVNEVSPVMHGAVVGRLVKNPAMHQSVLGLLKKLAPANQRQAELIAEQAAQEEVTETQTSLFGDEDVAQNLYLERAKILDAALSRIRQDRATFKVLADRAGTIVEEGNVLNKEANAARAENDAKVQAYLAAEANRKGPISEALTAAAKRLKAEPKTIGRIVGDFLKAIEPKPEGIGADGGNDGGAGRQDAGGSEGLTEAEPIDDGPGLFDAPITTEKTPEGIQTVIPGTERMSGADAKAAVTRDKAKAEIEARQRQSKMGRLNGNDGDSGPLFNDQTDMFGSAPSASEVKAAATTADRNPTEAQKINSGSLGRSKSGLTVQSKLLEASKDSIPSYAKLFGDGAAAEALSTKAFENLPVNMQRVVVAHVRRSLNDTKIFGAVIQAIPIDVMNVLIGKKVTTEGLAHDPSMLTHRLSVASDISVSQPIAAFINALVAATKLGFTFPITEESRLIEPAAIDLAHNLHPAVGTLSPEGRKVGGALGGNTEALFTAKNSVLDRGPIGLDFPADKDAASGAISGDYWHGDFLGVSGLVHINASHAQKEAGNYQLISAPWNGLTLSLESPKGALRKGTDSDGETWSVKMPAHYGYIRSFKPNRNEVLSERRVAEASNFRSFAEALPGIKKGLDLSSVIDMLSARIGALMSANPQAFSESTFRDPNNTGNRAAALAVRNHIEHTLNIPSDVLKASSINSDLDKAVRDSLMADAYFFGDTGKAATIRSHGYDSLDIEAKAMVKSHMFSSLKDSQVFNSVVQLIPIDVVDMLSNGEAASTMPLDNVSVFFDTPSIALNDAVVIGRFIDAIATNHPIAFAAPVAERILSAGKSVGIPKKGGSAEGAIGSGQVESSNNGKSYYTTVGADGDHIDFYMGDNPESDVVVVVDQVDAETRAFDEHKVMLGFANRKTALDFYVQGFSDGKGADRMGAHKVMTVSEFKEWLANGDTTKPVRLDAKVEAPKPTAKIADFGEKIGGAKKDRWSGYKDKMAEAEGVDVAAEPLSKSWPEPDYGKLIEDGVDSWTVGFIRAAREYVPRKPSVKWKVKQWAVQVELLRKFASDIMSGAIDPERLKQKLALQERLNAKISGKIALYEAVGHAKSLRDLTFEANKYSVLGGVYFDQAKVFWEVTKDQAATVFSNMPRVMVRADTKEDALAKFKEAYASLDSDGQEKGSRSKGTKFLIYSMRKEKTVTYRVGVKIGKNYIDLRTGIEDVKEARRIVAEEADQLQAKLDKIKEIPNERRDENSPRIGADHRNGADVTPEMFSNAFGFRGVEFGNWVEDSRRQEDLNNAFDAMMDLASILDLPPKAMSLNGSLGLAFGARGSGGKNPAAAHFEPGKIVINLTKRSGRGSLAHEWFHAMDNHFARKRSTPRGTYFTDNSSPGGPLTEGIRPEVVNDFIAVKRAILGTELKTRSANLDKTRSTPYWGTGIEMHARAFESYVIAKLQDQSASNDYLANVVNGTVWGMMAELSGAGDSYPYLKDGEIEVVRPAFDKLFQTIETRETDSGVEMYSRIAPDEAAYATQVLSELAQVDELFQNPKAKGRTIEAVMKEVDPLVTYAGDVAKNTKGTNFEGWAERIGADAIHLFRSASGKDFFVYTDENKVWLDVSRLPEGGAGSAIYAGVADFAINTHRKFIGDPEGLSDVALRRRTDNMLSSALKHGTTEHLEPHPRQIEGDKALGVQPLAWTEGDHAGNIAALIQVSFANLEHFLPAIGNARYDFATGTFRNSQGERLSDATFDQWRDRFGRIGEARAGRATLKRGILLHTLARTESGKRSSLLEYALRQPHKLVGDDLKRTFYSRTGADGAAQSSIRLRDLNVAVREELDRIGLTGRVAVRVASAMGKAGVFGRYSAGEITIGDGPGALAVLDHEIIHAMRDMGDGGLFTKDEWQGLVRAARADKELMARVESAYADLSTIGQMEEAVAELYRGWASGNRQMGAVGKAFAKVKAFFEALGNVLIGRGFQSAGKTMQDIASGKIGARDGGAVSSDAGGQDFRADLLTDKFKGMLGNKHWRKPDAAFFSSLLTDAMAGKNGYDLLAMVPGRALFTELGKNLISARAYQRGKEKMDTLRQDWHARADVAAQEWRKLRNKHPRDNDAFMDLMHRTTLAGIDPSKDDTWRHALHEPALREVSKNGDKAADWAKGVVKQIDDHKRAYRTLREKFAALPPAFQAMYSKLRAEYDKLGDDFEAAVIENIENATRIGLKRAEKAYRVEMQRIKDEGLKGAERDDAIAVAESAVQSARKRGGWGAKARIGLLRASFESNRLKGPYFPLARFGDYFVTIRDADGKVISFSRFEREADQKREVARAEQLHPGRVKFGVISKAEDGMKGQVDPTFVADIEKLLSDAGAETQVMDAVWQRWLETLPDQSIRTSKIHRKGREGWNADAFKAFGRHMFHGAHQLARLKYGLILEEHLNDAEDEARIADDPNRAMLVVNEMRRRHAFTMNPTGGAIPAALSQLAFIWYLGATPAAAIANLSQTTIVGIPVLAAKFKGAGISGSASALGKAMKDLALGKGDVSKSPNVTDDERSAIHEAYQRGTIDRTQGHDLAAVAESGLEYNAGRERIMKGISWFFHTTEKANREVTFLAAYRLAKDAGQASDVAVNTAADMTWKTHFDYQNNSRPRFMQNDFGKVLTTFKNFTVNMLYRLFRDTHQSLVGKSAEDRAEARTQLIGLTLSMMAHAGIKGTWGYGIIMLLVGMFFPGGSDDAEKWLQDSLLVEGDGPGVAAWNYAMGAALNGVPGQLTGVDLVNRIGMPSLWFRGSDRDLEGKDLYNAYLYEVLGPTLGGILPSMASGLNDVFGGEVERGAEAMAPKVIRDVLKSGRYVAEGVETRNGDTILESVNPYQALMQASGFTPAAIAERYQINSRLKNEEKRITDERTEIQRAAGDLIRSGEPISESVVEQIREFNATYPEYPITSDTIKQSVRSRIRASDRNEFGVALNPKLNGRLRANQPPSIYN